MKTGLILVLFALLVGCGRKETRFDLGQEYVTAFEKASQESGRPVKIDNLVIEWSEQTEVEASCKTEFAKTPRIQVSRSRWEQLCPTRREIVLFHEMGHCVLGRSHDDTVKSGMPVTLMHSHGVNVPTYNLYRDFYVKELFSAN